MFLSLPSNIGKEASVEVDGREETKRLLPTTLSWQRIDKADIASNSQEVNSPVIRR